MDKGRKAFQLINSVLVERTVGEVLPIVQENRDSILQVKDSIEGGLNKLVAEIKEFSAKYNSAFARTTARARSPPAGTPHARTPPPTRSPRAQARRGRGA
jgi:hypothetical protein